MWPTSINSTIKPLSCKVKDNAIKIRIVKIYVTTSSGLHPTFSPPQLPLNRGQKITHGFSLHLILLAISHTSPWRLVKRVTQKNK